MAARKTHPRRNDSPEQKRMLRSAEARYFDICRTFNEIQSGPNPLTPDEVEKLSRLRPQYAMLAPRRKP